MIYYLTSERNAGVMQAFLGTWGHSLVRRIAIVSYERLIAEKHFRLPSGTYIFTSIGQSLGTRDPPSPARQWAIRLHAALIEQLGPARVLNDPSHSLRRFGLLRALGEADLNRFQVHRAGDGAADMRFPVFLRHEYGTVWNAPALLATREAYETELTRTDNAGLLAIEYCDTRDAHGIYRKYGCFVVGERIVPRHLFLSRNWLVKSADIVDGAVVGEELAVLEANPHAETLLRACRLANISYGRIDYALLDGAPQIWEINITPQIVTRPGEDTPDRNPAHEKFAAAFAAAMAAIDPAGA